MDSVVPDFMNEDALKSEIVIENQDMITNPEEAQKKFIQKQDEHEKKYREYIRGKIGITAPQPFTNHEDQAIDILKDTVNRLTKELAKYQKKYPPVIDVPLDEIILLSVDQEDWNAHYNFMKPLFNSYDTKISELMNENNLTKSNLEKINVKNNSLLKENAFLQGKINDILKENAELKTNLSKLKSENDTCKIEIDKLKSSQLQQQQQQNPSDLSFYSFEQQKFNYDQWEEANAKIEVLEQENDLLIKQQKDSKKEMEMMKMEMNKKNMEEVEKNLEICNENFNKSSNDNSMLQNDLCLAMNEIREYKKKLSEYKKSLEEITIRYQTHVKEATEMAANEKRLIDQLKISDEELTTQKQNYANALEEINNLRNQQVELLQLSKDMEKRINELEKKEVDLNKQIQCHINIAEEAKLNCDRALIKEDHYVKEIQRLKNSLTENTCKFTEKSEKNISLIVAKHESEKQRLLKEINMLEVSSTEAKFIK
ncbi:hypothetical protein LY90DRAFT_503879 [Neocallimastix californiae]|uniref:Uncharacterized protein n=1 Tax=Neocallimastix californiae TaxID=1754190 RepID=A0A1Y2ELD0_9FUNG|nr:hypothetical protein LY90DRAFT_503879 [Neocallimastix californiae]|eukprot:ORY72349.1 hypothetical protein LY90DRAFT_503879 [Neocallimastix californiae]